MPINAYNGLQGSGKSYEVVSTVIVDAVAKGRRVVTNVDGIDSDMVRAFIHEKRGIAMDKLGEVVHCTNERVEQENFFPHGTADETFVQPGDLVAIDEAWRFWAGDSRITPEHRIFFREHRHYCHPETKVSCDLVLMTQDIGDLNRLLKAVVELSFRTTKIKSLGMNKTYRIEMWEGWKQAAKNRIRVEVKRYDPEVFPLYSSYVGGKGNEVQVDKRQNILTNKRLWFMAGFMVLMLGVGSYFGLRFFKKPQEDAAKAKAAAARASGQPASSPAPVAGQATVPGLPKPAVSVDRIVGTYRVRGQTFVLLSDGTGTYRPEHPSMLQREGMLQVISEGDRMVRRFELASPPTSRKQQ